MDLKSIALGINSFLLGMQSFFDSFFHYLGIDTKVVGGVVNLMGLLFAGLITVFIVTVGIISYIKGTQLEPFTSSYEDDAFVKGRAGTIMGVLTIVCAVWFLFALVYISLNNGF